MLECWMVIGFKIILGVTVLLLLTNVNVIQVILLLLLLIFYFLERITHLRSMLNVMVEWLAPLLHIHEV